MHARPFLSTHDIPNRSEKLLDLCALLPDVFESFPNSFESLPSWDVDSLGCIRDTPFSFETLTDLFITLPYYFEKLPVWFERICDIFQILLLSLWHFLSCLKHILTWWVSSCPLEMCLLCLKHLQSWGSSWLTLTCPRPFMTCLRPVVISLFDTLPDKFETPWHIMTFLNYWRLLFSVWGIYLFETLPYFESVPGLFEMICDGWDAVSLIVTLCVWKGETLLKHDSKHVWKGEICLKHFLTVWDPS